MGADRRPGRELQGFRLRHHGSRGAGARRLSRRSGPSRPVDGGRPRRRGGGRRRAEERAGLQLEARRRQPVRLVSRADLARLGTDVGLPAQAALQGRGPDRLARRIRPCHQRPALDARDARGGGPRLERGAIVRRTLARHARGVGGAGPGRRRFARPSQHLDRLERRAALPAPATRAVRHRDLVVHPARPQHVAGTPPRLGAAHEPHVRPRRHARAGRRRELEPEHAGHAQPGGAPLSVELFDESRAGPHRRNAARPAQHRNPHQRARPALDLPRLGRLDDRGRLAGAQARSRNAGRSGVMPDMLAPAMAPSLALRLEVESFYYDEAALLDQRRYREWLDLFTDDTHYWMPVRRTKASNQLDGEFSRLGDMAFFDDNKAMLTMRVRRLETGYAWAEEPPSRTRHLVTNVRIVAADGEHITAESNFHLHRTRLASDENNWIGLRRDVLQRSDGLLRIAARHIFLEQTVLLAPNLSNFF